MINYIIIEDESAAQRRLKRKITEIRPDWVCSGVADSIITAKELISTQSHDLIFSDIELSDGNCFEVFNNLVTSPIIFITAYDIYAIKAFEFNSIQYLLKPINDQKLVDAITKFEHHPSIADHSKIFAQLSYEKISSTIVSKVGDKTTLIRIEEIAYCYHQQRTTKAYLVNGNSYILDQSLEVLLTHFPSDQFFRINRQAIINKRIITRFIKQSSNRLSLETNPKSNHELVVSKENTRKFKDWIG